jgi:hypothetical protein
MIVSEDHQQLERMASAIEDLLYMDAIRLGPKEGEKALFSPQFSLIITNIIESMKIKDSTEEKKTMKLMYYSLLIFMSEYLKMPKSLMMALGNDWEKNKESMESGEIINTYVSILVGMWMQNNKK